MEVDVVYKSDLYIKILVSKRKERYLLNFYSKVVRVQKKQRGITLTPPVRVITSDIRYTVKIKEGRQNL